MSARRITLRTKLLAGFGAVLALMAVLSFVSMKKLDAVQHGAVVANEMAIPSVSLIDDVYLAMEVFRQQEFRHLSERSAEGRAAAEKIIQAEVVELRRGLAGYTKLVTDERDRAFLTRSRPACSGWSPTGRSSAR